MANPRVSIVTPTYNRADYLPETIDSILSQSYDQFEYTIIDDGSSDGTADLVAGYAPQVSYRFLRRVDGYCEALPRRTLSLDSS